MGGYEYTPEAMAERDSDLLVKKHNEASLVLSKLFSDKNYSVSLINPVNICCRYKPTILYSLFKFFNKYKYIGN